MVENTLMPISVALPVRSDWKPLPGSVKHRDNDTDRPINSTDLITLRPVLFKQFDTTTGEGEIVIERVQIEAGEWHEVPYSDFIDNLRSAASASIARVTDGAVVR